MVQLNACLLLLFVIASDQTLASLQHRCNEHISLSQEPTGHIGLSSQEEVAHTPRTGPRVCTRTLEIPAGHAVHLKLVWLERGSDISLRCVLGEKDQVLEIGDAALLSGCDLNKATLTWTGAGNSSNAFQLFYYVQEDESNSIETSSSPRSDYSIVTTKYPHLSEQVGYASSGPGPSTHDPARPQIDTPLPGTGFSDREALLFPEEELNNGADTSGALHHTDSPGTRDYFHTQHSTSTDSAFHTSQTANTETVSELSTGREVYKASHTLKEKTTATTHMPFSEFVSTTQPQNAPISGTIHKKTQDTTKIEPSISTQVSTNPESLRTHDYFHTQNSTSAKFEINTITNTKSSSRTPSSTGRDLYSISSTLEYEEKRLSSSRMTLPTHLEIGSTHITGITNEKTLDSAWSEQTIGTQVSGSTTAVTFDSLNSSGAPTQESLRGVDTDRTPLSSSLGRSSASPVPDLDTALGRTPTSQIPESELAATQTSVTTDLFTSHSFMLTSPSLGALGGTNRDEAKTEGSQRNVLTTVSYFNDTTDSEQTKPSSTVSAGGVVVHDEGTTAHPETISINSRFVKGLKTDSPPTTASQQTLRTHKNTMVSDEIFPITESYQHTTATTSQVPYQRPPSPTSAYTGHRKERKRATTARGSHHTPSWTRGPVSSTTTFTQPDLSSAPIRGSTVHHKPKFYIVPDEPAIIRVESVKLLLQIILEESTVTEGLEEDAALWLEPYLQRAPGFRGLLGVWSSGHAVQCHVEFDTRGALQWLNHTAAAASLLEQTGLSQAVRERRSFRSDSITNITLGGLQGDVCGWLLQCPSGFTCVLQPYTSDYSCTSVCHSDYCHHHGLCTHHPAQPPVCRCLAGEDFWFMGQRCDVRMTRARLVVSCLAVLLIVVGVIGVLAFLIVRRYRALLIQAKVDQTRSSYRRFNHFDELSARFWLRSWAGSADSLDNPAFTRSDELLHLRALERPCCYHDDTMSLPSTCPSPGMHIRTIYPHSSQYAWRGSNMSLGDGVLDSGKASDLSVCSWPVEPIQWTPFPLLQQLSTQRPPAVRVSRPRSYCEGMELVDISKSWTA